MSTASTHQPFVFSPAATATVGAGDAPVMTAETMVQDTRREISEIVRELAIEARSERPTHEFFALLADRVLRAMAAEGVVIWGRADEDESFRPLTRLGRITDQSIASASAAPHQMMLVAVANEGQPVVVPATPGAVDADVPSNPAEVPVAAVPIEHDPTQRINYLLEVFLEPEGGVATQRGYLRFAAQMADLASEYLRSAQLRQFREEHRIAGRVDRAIHTLHRYSDPRKVEAAIVDAAAEVFGFDRVGLCMVNSAHTTLAAVSHTDKIDQRSDGAQQLRTAADAVLKDGLAVIMDPDDDSAIEPLGVVFAADSTDNAMRLVAFGSVSPALESQHELKRFAKHAAVALRNASRFEAIPGGRILAALAPTLDTPRVRWWLRPIFTCCVLTMLIIVAMFPVPLHVASPATIHPASVQQLTAPRNAIVQAIHVDHGQPIVKGQPLLTLMDPNLEQEITGLIGRRAVLVQKLARWNELLVDTASHQREQTQRAQSEQSLIREEIIAIDSEMQQLRQAQAGLVLRADRDGVVDAWRLRERLSDRPLIRGDSIAQVIAADSQWLVDVQVAQNRISHLLHAIESDQLEVRVALEATPDETMSAQVVDFGPTVSSETGGAAGSVPSTLVRLRLSEAATQQFRGVKSNAAAPARVTFFCGKQPAAYVLFQDVIRSVRATAGLYFGDTES